MVKFCIFWDKKINNRWNDFQRRWTLLDKFNCDYLFVCYDVHQNGAKGVCYTFRADRFCSLMFFAIEYKGLLKRL
jgi:hypothetical protein